MPKKTHTEQDWQELGKHLYDARRALMSASTQASKMFGNTHPLSTEVNKALEITDRLRSSLDNQYRKERPHPLKESLTPETDPTYGQHQRSREEWHA